MEPVLYEQHYLNDPDFPFIFHFDQYNELHPLFPAHYHESMELLYIIEGSATVILDGREWQPHAGQCVAVNQNTLHSIRSEGTSCMYACLIIGEAFCKQIGVGTAKVELAPLVEDTTVKALFCRIIEEIEQKQPYYKTRVKGLVLYLLGVLCSSHQKKDSLPLAQVSSQKQKLAHSAVDYIQLHLAEPVTLQNIAEALHVSKFYLSRVFKEITGETVTFHLNTVRCNYARQLLRLGCCNVSQAAYRSGFRNLSYFTRIYKSRFDLCPVEDYNFHEPENL